MGGWEVTVRVRMMVTGYPSLASRGKQRGKFRRRRSLNSIPLLRYGLPEVGRYQRLPVGLGLGLPDDRFFAPTQQLVLLPKAKQEYNSPCYIDESLVQE